MTKKTIQIPIHKAFLPLLANNGKKYKGFETGRGAGKSWNMARCGIIKVRTEKRIPFGCFKGTLNSIEDSVYKVIEQQINLLGLQDEFEFTNKNITHKSTGSYFIFKGLQNVGRLQSLEGVKYAWVEEAQYDYDEDKHDKFYPTIRTPGSEIWYSYNPNEPEDFIVKFFHEEREDKELIKLSYRDNPYLTDEYRREIELDRESDYAKYLWKWEGHFKPKGEGSIFKPNWIKYEDIEVTKTVVAIDPSVTSHEKSDLCGLVVAGKGPNFYSVIDDQSAIMTPHEWASRAIQLYYKYDADYIVYENNQGGDIIKTVLRQIDPAVPVKDVRATKGKLLRAEPVASLYEQGLVYHAKRFTELEYEMTTYSGDGKSPDHLDAMVYAILSLMTKQTHGGSYSGAVF